MKTKFIRTSFSDFYGPGQTNIRQYAESKYGGTINPTDQNVHVHDCFFHFCSSSSSGGALYCSSNVYKLLIEETTFICCRTSGRDGGAIYFSSTTNGECILYKICGFNCSSTYSSNSYGQFARIEIKNDITYKNRVNDSSISHSLKISTNNERTLYLNYGNILCPSINLTNNECYRYVAIYCYPLKDTGSPVSETCCISYSSFVNNTASPDQGCIGLDSPSSSQRIDTCNILNNKQDSSSYGIIHTISNLLIKDSCILGNNKDNKVFHAYSSNNITISNCTIDDDIFTNQRYGGSLIAIKTIEKSFINALSHIVTQHCDSYFDSFGTLTAKPNVPSRISRFLMSCNNKCQRTDELGGIQFIFLLTLLLSDPESDYYIDFNCLF